MRIVVNWKRMLVALLIFAAALSPGAVAKTAPTDVQQVIVPIVVSSPSAIAGCTLLVLNPGSAVSGTSGWIMATCPNAPAILFNGTIETPTFVLTSGWDSIVAQVAGLTPCSAPHIFKTLTGPKLSGVTLTAAVPINFSVWTNTTIPAGGYNYCLHYSNPSINGILSFTISWNP
jgi:hypothetical protein